MEKQIRNIFGDAVRAAKTADEMAKRELLREYFTNPDFRKALEDEVARVNNT